MLTGEEAAVDAVDAVKFVGVGDEEELSFLLLVSVGCSTAEVDVDD